MFCKDNIAKLGDQPFVVAERLKNLPKQIAEEVTNLEQFKTLADGVKCYETRYLDQRLIVTWSALRAAKDAHEREKALKRLLNKYDNKPCKTLVNNGYAKYLGIEGEGRVLLDEAKIRDATRWDGLHGMLTNVDDLTPEQALEQYHGLWQVEETFRLSKHDLSMRVSLDRTTYQSACCDLFYCIDLFATYAVSVRFALYEAISRGYTTRVSACAG